jgi:hypothetical protein
MAAYVIKKEHPLRIFLVESFLLPSKKKVDRANYWKEVRRWLYNVCTLLRNALLGCKKYSPPQYLTWLIAMYSDVYVRVFGLISGMFSAFNVKGSREFYAI